MIDWFKIIKYAAIPLALLIAGLVYKYYPSAKQDNAIEEFVEDFLHGKTGVNVDLSPESKER
jgi:uncharacterized membrane protein YukC